MARQHHHLGDRLIEQDRRGIVIEGAVFGWRQDFATTRRPADGNREEVLEGGADFDAHDVVGGARVIEVGFQQRAEPLGKGRIARGDDDAGLAPDREFAGDAGAADRGDGEVQAGAALDFGGDMIGERVQCAVARRQALGDHHDIDRVFERLAQAIDRPADAGRADAKEYQIGIGTRAPRQTGRRYRRLTPSGSFTARRGCRPVARTLSMIAVSRWVPTRRTS